MNGRQGTLLQPWHRIGEAPSRPRPALPQRVRKQPGGLGEPPGAANSTNQPAKARAMSTDSNHNAAHEIAPHVTRRALRRTVGIEAAGDRGAATHSQRKVKKHLPRANFDSKFVANERTAKANPLEPRRVRRATY